jgi:hypothetical protein
MIVRRLGAIWVVLILCSLPTWADDKTETPTIGKSVFAFYKSSEAYFAATVVEEDKDNKGMYRVVFEDGDTALVAATEIRPLDVKVGTKVFARWNHGKYYPGKVEKLVGRALYIHYDDGDKGWASMGTIAVK